MKSLFPVRLLYGIAAAYEIALGLAFIAAGPTIFSALEITPPNHWGYLHFSAGLLLVFGFMFFQLARDPVAHRELVPYAILFKLCYVATVAWHWANGDVPALWKAFAAADVVFAGLFGWSWSFLPRAESAHPDAPAAPVA